MKKDKEWLEKEINKTLNIDGGSGERIEGFNKGLEFSLDLIEELDEPEPPVIPQYVAEYIDSARRENATLLGAMDYFLNSKEIKSWMRVNQELFAKAWLDGYTIEKEKQYRVVFPSLTGTEEHFLVQGDNGIGGFWLDGDWDYIESSDMKAFFTEQEIKAIDSRYWQFAEEVTND